jgi:predicted transcriptional regulator
MKIDFVEAKMFTLTLDDETAKKLQAVARQRNRTPNEVLRDLLEKVDEPQPTSSHNWALKMAQMAEADTSVEWNESASNLAENSRDILDNEFADYLLKRTESKDE